MKTYYVVLRCGKKKGYGRNTGLYVRAKTQNVARKKAVRVMGRRNIQGRKRSRRKCSVVSVFG